MKKYITSFLIFYFIFFSSLFTFVIFAWLEYDYKITEWLIYALATEFLWFFSFIKIPSVLRSRAPKSLDFEKYSEMKDYYNKLVLPIHNLDREFELQFQDFKSRNISVFKKYETKWKTLTYFSCDMVKIEIFIHKKIDDANQLNCFDYFAKKYFSEK
ncbi:hypothetical protein [Spiroplasma alleghenense]|nr:hypothetical protein [Spiroplasma alleghenense]